MRVNFRNFHTVDNLHSLVWKIFREPDHNLLLSEKVYFTRFLCALLYHIEEKREIVSLTKKIRQINSLGQ